MGYHSNASARLNHQAVGVGDNMAASKKDSELIRGFQLMAAYHHDGSFNKEL